MFFLIHRRGTRKFSRRIVKLAVKLKLQRAVAISALFFLQERSRNREEHT